MCVCVCVCVCLHAYTCIRVSLSVCEVGLRIRTTEKEGAKVVNGKRKEEKLVEDGERGKEAGGRVGTRVQG